MSSATLRPCLVISPNAASHSEAPTTKFCTKPPKTLSLPSRMTAAASLSSTSTTTPMDIETTSVPKKVLIPIAYGTEEMEAVIMVNVLRLAGADVVLASVEPQLEVEASSGTRLVADTSISTCSNQIFDLIAFPGGMPGSARLRDCMTLQEITMKQAEEKRLFGAICAAPAVTLMPWGLLKRKKTTCHPAFMDKLPTFWAVKTNLQVSGELTTSRGPGTCFQFSVSLVEQLFGESSAMEIRKLLLMDAADELHRKDEFNEVEWAVDHTPHVLIPVANGFEEIEVVTIVDILRRGKVDVVVASVEKSSKISGSQGTKIVADKLIKDAAELTYDLIILPGGASGVERLDKSRILKKLLKQQVSDGRKYGAVCASPSILQRQGLLKDKRATGNPSVLSMLNNNSVVGSRVVIDGTVITCSGLSSTIDFALVIVAKFFGHARARSVAEGLVFKYPRS